MLEQLYKTNWEFESLKFYRGALALLRVGTKFTLVHKIATHAMLDNPVEGLDAKSVKFFGQYTVICKDHIIASSAYNVTDKPGAYVNNMTRDMHTFVLDAGSKCVTFGLYGFDTYGKTWGIIV